MAAKRGREEWCATVDGLLTSSGPVAITDDAKAYLDARRKELLAEKGFTPQMTAEEGYRAQPLQPNVTDDLMNEEHDEPNFDKSVGQLVSSLVGTKASRQVSSGGLLAEGAARTLNASAVNTVRRLAVDFMPVILLPSTPSSILQIWNALEFVTEGKFTEAHKKFMRESDGSTIRQEKEPWVIAGPRNLIDTSRYRVKFNNFRFTDDPSQIENWDHVCACFTTGSQWQFDGWFNGDNKRSDPAQLFQELRGFIPFYEEDKPAETTKLWNVVPLQMTRKTTKSTTLHLRAAAIFWDEVYSFLDSHPRFRNYTLTNN